MDGSPSRGETIPIRLFLGGFDLTPTFRDVNKKFSTRYYLSLVLIDEGKETARILQQANPLLTSGRCSKIFQTVRNHSLPPSTGRSPRSNYDHGCCPREPQADATALASVELCCNAASMIITGGGHALLAYVTAFGVKKLGLTDTKNEIISLPSKILEPNPCNS